MTRYVDGLNVAPIDRVEPAPPWEYVTARRSTRLPSFENTETGEVIRVSPPKSQPRRPDTWKAWHHSPSIGAPSSIFDPLLEASTAKQMAEKLRAYFAENGGGVSI